MIIKPEQNINRLGQNITRKINRTSSRKNHINSRISRTSYRPTINEKLVSLKSMNRSVLNHCNNVKAFKLI